MPLKLKEIAGTGLLARSAKTRETFGTAYIEQNPLTGTWFIFGQKGETLPYTVENKGVARRLAKTVDHWNKTGEIKKF